MDETKVKFANPATLGLLGFGLTAIMLNLHNAMLIDLSVVIVAAGLAIGGSAQIIAGLFEMKQGNTFAGTAFIAYGFFWISLVFIWVYSGDMVFEADGISMGFYLALWGVFSLFMFICTFRHNRAIWFTFLTLTILFFGLAAGDFTGIDIIILISGYVGIVCGASAFYTGMAIMLKEEFGREVLPLCEMKRD
ncbi:MAG: acetate uptake transporter [Clostridiales bacterium]|nr:acetate uptake transporter [Clostridiales bacterium]